MVHHFTIDVEEHFQVSAMEPHLPRAEWDAFPSRVEASTLRIVELLEEHGMHGTFFVLGWVARRRPELVRRIAEGGHEVASHGWDHRRVTALDPTQFRRQVRESRDLLESLSGAPVLGYRAPSFSIVPGLEWALEILAEEGYRYDSSLYPVRRRGYGYPGGKRRPHALDLGEHTLIEFPPLTLRLLRANLPAGGGGTFRQFPLGYTAQALRRSEAAAIPGTFYIHPWEVDPEQPRVPGLPFLTRVRHYRGIGQTMARLRRLLSTFAFRPIRDTLAELEPVEVGP
jgi:polysaccharide deacetylase family protein (PEP-CTERM system associated)